MEEIIKKQICKDIEKGTTSLGIEFGSTRIKAILVDKKNNPIGAGSYEWENKLENEIWTYHEDEIWKGLQLCYQSLQKDIWDKYQMDLKRIGAIGISGMMHGYLVLDEEGKWLVPFRTWRNTITENESQELTDLFGYHIPQRFSIAHLRHAMKNKETHVENIKYMTTLAGYIHWKLTGEKVLGIGDASGMFPIDIHTKNYNKKMMQQFNALVLEETKYSWSLEDILPKVLVAGEEAGCLKEEAVTLLDMTGTLEAGALFCPPEGDAGTGMAATNSVAKRTGNISAGTSIFAMLVLEDELKGVYPEIDLVTTPAGNITAMVHCNNCTSDLNAWLGIFKEYAEKLGGFTDINQIYTSLFQTALEADCDGGKLLSYCYLSGEHITGVEKGAPLFVRTPDSNFTLGNFMRTNIMTTFGAIRMGFDILWENENIKLDKMYGHGGLFKTPKVGQSLLAAALKTPVAVMETAGEGGAWGIAILASYMKNKSENENLEEFLENKVFKENKESMLLPEEADVEGFDQFMERYRKGLAIEKKAVSILLQK